MHSTNYFNVFIEVAEDTRATVGTVPPARDGKKSVANYEYEMLSKAPYQYTSDDVFLLCMQKKQNSESKARQGARSFFAKGRPCFRASPLTKTYGWGVHSNKEGKVAIFAVDSKEYAALVKGSGVEKKKAMRSSGK